MHESKKSALEPKSVLQTLSSIVLCALLSPPDCSFRPSGTSDCHYCLYIWTIFRPTDYWTL